MRIGLISDLHVDVNIEYPIMEILGKEISRQKIDLLIIAGDISESPDKTIMLMKLFDKMLGDACGLLFVPGNHDMWNKVCPDRAPDEIYNRFVLDERCLAGKVIRLAGAAGKPGLILTGDIGWYDYTLAYKGYAKEKLDEMEDGGRTWQDKLYNPWTNDNQARMERSIKDLTARFETCMKIRETVAGAENDDIMVVTHMVPLWELSVTDAKPEWQYFNAFLGSSRLQELYKKYPVKYAVSGHVHFRKELEKDGIKHICPCLGYFNEWERFPLNSTDAEANVKDALYIMEV